MTTTLSQELTNLGIDLDDANNVYNSTASLTQYINQGCVEIARRAECLLDMQSCTAITNISYYLAPANCVRLHQVTFSPLNNPQQIYPLMYKGKTEMNAIWGVNQNLPGSYPQFYTTWKNPPAISIQVFPVPAQAGSIGFWYYRLPNPVANGTDLIDLPDGYEDCLRAYVRYCARRRAGDQMWTDDKALYEESLSTLITNSRNWTDEAGQMTIGTSFLPTWLYDDVGGW